MVMAIVTGRNDQRQVLIWQRRAGGARSAIVMVRGGRDHCGTRIPSFYGGDDDGDDVDVDDVDKDYFGD